MVELDLRLWLGEVPGACAHTQGGVKTGTRCRHAPLVYIN